MDHRSQWNLEQSMVKFGQAQGLLVGFLKVMIWVYPNQKVQLSIMPIFLNTWAVVLLYPITHIGHYVGRPICGKDRLISVHQIQKQGLMKDFGINLLVITMQHTHLTMFTNLSQVISWNMMIHQAQNESTNFIDQERTMKSTITGLEQIM